MVNCPSSSHPLLMTLQPLPTPRLDLECLLVDDNETVLQALASLLRSEGFEVTGQARTGVEALQLLNAVPATAIILDVNLPDLSGLEVARRAVEVARKQMPVIFYTSYADQNFVAAALDAGARGIVLKDAPPVNLLDAISAVVQGGIYIDPRLRVSAAPEQR
jgi:DNA-binding NarL/FixJ family response regulator